MHAIPRLAALALCLAALAGSSHAKTQQHDEKRELDVCAASMDWRSANGKIYLNDSQFHIKGANWFGFETGLNVVHGLWGATTMAKVLDFCKANKINALRIPLSVDLAIDQTTRVPLGSCVECAGARSWDVLDKLFTEAAKRGILILLDMHRLNKTSDSELWYDGTHSEAQIMLAWSDLLKKFGAKPNLLGIDLKHEPHGKASWGMNTPATDWDKAAVRIVQAILTKVPTYNKLIFIEGIGTGNSPTKLSSTEPAYQKFDGSNLDGVFTHPIDLGTADLNSRIVYSPHLFGPSVKAQAYFADPTFPSNMPRIWDRQVGFVENETGKALVLGEWGGTHVGLDRKWGYALASYMTSRCINDNFVWAINPNAGDTGGILLADWKTPNTDKLSLMAQMQPTPSKFTSAITATAACVSYGAPASVTCFAPPPFTAPPTQPPKPTAQPTTPPPTPRPTTEGGCALPWAQCAGIEFGDQTCCPPKFFCNLHNEWYSQCEEIPMPTPTPTTAMPTVYTPTAAPTTGPPQPPTPVPTFPLCNVAYSQCNGEGWPGTQCCPSGFSCQAVNSYLSQCLPVDYVPPAADEPAADEPAPAAPDATANPAIYTLCHKQGEQCGGIGWLGKRCCQSGLECGGSDPWYSSCMPIGSFNYDATDAPVEAPYSGPCASPWKQCGGKLWDGAKCCVEGTNCQFLNEWFSQCIPIATTEGTKGWWDQCGGLNYKGVTLCLPGSVCVVRNPWYSQCEPTAVPPGQADKFQDPDIFFQDTTDEYVPGGAAAAAEAGDEGLPTVGEPLVIAPEPVVVVAPEPTIVPTWGQCGGKEYVGPNTCEAGSTCEYNNEYYSQCLPISKVESETCRYHWEQCGGFGYTGSSCCVAGWACDYVNDWYSQCVPIGKANAN